MLTRQRRRHRKRPRIDQAIPDDDSEDTFLHEDAVRGASSTSPDGRVKKLLNELWKQEWSKDVSIVCSGNRRLMVHSAVLTCASSFIKGVLLEEKSFLPGKFYLEDAAVVMLPDFDLKLVEHLAKKCYLVEDMEGDGKSCESQQLSLGILCQVLGLDYDHGSSLKKLNGFKLRLFRGHHHRPSPYQYRDGKRHLPFEGSKRSLLGANINLMVGQEFENGSQDEASSDCQYQDVQIATDGDEGKPMSGLEVDSSISASIGGQQRSTLLVPANDRSSVDDLGESDVSISSKAPFNNSAANDEEVSKSNGCRRGEFSELCPYCGEMFTNRTLLKYHMLKEERSEPLRCEIEGCSFLSLTSAKVKEHVREAHKSERLVSSKGTKAPPTQCDLCSLQVSNVERHKAECHVETNPFQCPDCPCRFLRKPALSMHHARFHRKKDHRCECGALFRKKSLLTQHLRHMCPLPEHRLQEKLPFKCHLCEFRAGSHKTLANHLGLKHKERKYVCDCGNKLRSTEGLMKHLKGGRCKLIRDEGKCMSDLLKQCDKCPMKVLNMDDHYDRFHDESLPHSCDGCFFRCSSRFRLKQHITNHHSEKKHFCACSKGFTSIPLLRIHERNCSQKGLVRRQPGGSNERFPCPECHYVGVNEIALKLHRTRHHCVDKIKCECGLLFNTIRILNKHVRQRCSMRDEIMKRWLKCATCSFLAADSKSLQIHEGKFHTGEKKYVCECGIGWTRKDLLSSHYKNNCVLNKDRKNKRLHFNAHRPVASDVIIKDKQSLAISEALTVDVGSLLQA